jgi:hypothetical protein
MSKLTDLFQAVKEENLNKYQLEQYHKELSDLYSQMFIELGEVKKRKAIFLANSTLPTTAAKKIAWEASEDGQREIELKSFVKATAAQRDSLKSRLYAMY